MIFQQTRKSILPEIELFKDTRVSMQSFHATKRRILASTSPRSMRRAFPRSVISATIRGETREPERSVSRRFYSVLYTAGGSPLCSPRPNSREQASRNEETRCVPRGDNTRRNRDGEWAANEINAGMFCACLCISAFFPLFSSQGVFSEQQVRGVRGLSARYDRQRLGLEEQC